MPDFSLHLAIFYFSTLLHGNAYEYFATRNSKMAPLFGMWAECNVM